jgi:hypothetical protein
MNSSTTTYIKGYFYVTPQAEEKLAQLGIKNPAGYQRASEGLWDSVYVPAGIFKHTRGNLGTPGTLDLA